MSKLSDAQLRACHAFGQYAINQLRGVTGTEEYQGRRISASAAKVARDYPSTGQGVFGGMSEQERRNRRHQRAESNVQRMSRMLDERGTSSGRSRMAQTDGGRDMDAPEQG